jgi:hypothetical protein
MDERICSLCSKKTNDLSDNYKEWSMLLPYLERPEEYRMLCLECVSLAIEERANTLLLNKK